MPGGVEVKASKEYKELEKIKADQDRQENQTQAQTPLDQLVEKLGTIQQDVRKQRLETETNLQGAFSQAAEGLADAKAVSQLMQVVGSLSQLAKNEGLQGSASQYHDLLNQLDADLNQQIQTGSQQVVKSLQQGVVALAQANSALLDSHNFHQIKHYVQQCRLLLSNWETSGNTQIH